MSTKPSTPAACPPQPRRRAQLSGIFTIALAALLSLLITAAPARANLCCNPLTNACLVAVTGSCPGGFYLIPGAACSPNPCFATWSVGPWSACSTTCGPGVQTRTVQCTIAGTILPDSQCATAGAKPATTQSCNPGPCDSFVWTTGAWGSCSAPCGGGTRTRTVACISVLTGAVVSDALCTGTRPQSSEACNTQPCPPAEWTVGDWSACSTTCGPGIQTRTVQCTIAGIVVADVQCASAGPRPATTQPCNLGPCDSFVWTTGEWGACSAPCGGGTRTRTVACVSVLTGAVVSDALCTTTRPQSAEACNTQACPPPAQWVVGPWSACSTTCGPGTQTRTVQCVVANVIVADSECASAGAKPATIQSCDLGACVGACCLGSTCLVAPPAACATSAGRYVGDLSACNLPGEVITPCCFADFNASGSVTVQDLFDYLAAYFAADPRADFNVSTTITVQDLFDYLAAYFSGC